jgi:hypothetical protein
MSARASRSTSASVSGPARTLSDWSVNVVRAMSTGGRRGVTPVCRDFVAGLPGSAAGARWTRMSTPSRVSCDSCQRRASTLCQAMSARSRSMSAATPFEADDSTTSRASSVSRNGSMASWPMRSATPCCCSTSGRRRSTCAGSHSASSAA